MPPKPISYSADLVWTGAEAGPAVDIKGFSRAFVVRYSGKPVLTGSSDPHFFGDATRHNPEEMLLAALTSCHMLTWVYLAVRAGIAVHAYEDRAEATLSWVGDTYAFTAATLRPRIRVGSGADLVKAEALHHDAHTQCFVARSVNFPVTIAATFSQ